MAKPINRPSRTASTVALEIARRLRARRARSTRPPSIGMAGSKLNPARRRLSPHEPARQVPGEQASGATGHAPVNDPTPARSKTEGDARERTGDGDGELVGRGARKARRSRRLRRWAKGRCLAPRSPGDGRRGSERARERPRTQRARRSTPGPRGTRDRVNLPPSGATTRRYEQGEAPVHPDRHALDAPRFEETDAFLCFLLARFEVTAQWVVLRVAPARHARHACQ